MKKNWVIVAKLINVFGKRRATKGNLGVQEWTCESAGVGNIRW